STCRAHKKADFMEGHGRPVRLTTKGIFMAKTVSQGAWVRVSKLPVGTSESDLSEFFRTCGLYVPVEAIAMRDVYTNPSALVSVPYETIADMLNFLTNHQTMGGWHVRTSPMPVRAA